MSDHYYTAQPGSEHKLREVEAELFGIRFVFTTDAGVFSRDGVDPGTRALIGSIPPQTGRVLDLGCGWGAAGIPIRRRDPECTLVMTDINERAAGLARSNAERNGAGDVTVVTGDGFEAVEGSFDTILTNPPIRAGKQKIYDLFREARDRLVPGGMLYLVIRKQQGAPSALKYLQECFGDARVIDRSGGYWIIAARRAEE